MSTIYHFLKYHFFSLLFGISVYLFILVSLVLLLMDVTGINEDNAEDLNVFMFNSRLTIKKLEN